MRRRRIAQARLPIPGRLVRPGDLLVDLSRSFEVSRQKHRTAIGVPAILWEMLRTFHASDRDFRVWQWDGRSQAAGPDGSGGGGRVSGCGFS